MTPQERKLIDELFDRLAKLESSPRDPDAVRAINEALARAPNALYPLVQTVLVQDEALKRADGRIRELEGELGIDPGQPASQPGFLDSMRDSLFGRPQQGSVPSVRSGQAAWGRQSQPHAQTPQAGAFGGGGSFLGTAAATAAGVVTGALLMQSFRGMFGQPAQAQPQSAFEPQAGGPSPWGEGGGDLARQAGIDDIGRGGRGDYGAGGAERHGLFDTAQADTDSSDFDSDFDLGGTGDV